MNSFQIDTCSKICDLHGVTWCIDENGNFFTWEVFSDAKWDKWVRIGGIKQLKEWLGY